MEAHCHICGADFAAMQPCLPVPHAAAETQARIVAFIRKRAAKNEKFTDKQRMAVHVIAAEVERGDWQTF